ncbi:MAG: DUF3754 domain-containing protein [Pirellulales bacterium]
MVETIETVADREPSRRETFLPLHSTDLVEFLSRHPALQGSTEAQFRHLASFILSLQHHLYRQRHEQLTYLYAPLDPDRDTLLLSVPVLEERNRRCEELFGRIDDALQRANYHRLVREDIERAMSGATQWGVRMRVDFDAFDRVEVYARGNKIGKKSLRHWRRFFRLKTFEVPLYQRLVVIFRIRPEYERRDKRFDSHRLYLRMFKNIPQQDVDMVMPATKLKMTWWDHSQIVLPSIYAIVATLGKLLRYVVLLTLLGIFKTAAMVLLIIVAVAYGVKSMFTYTINTRRRYHLNVAQNLVIQSLDNNAGALLRILEEGEQQEACEAVLGFFAAAVLMPDIKDIKLDEVDRTCESLIHEATGIHIDFDVQDAVKDLVHLGLMRAAGERWEAVSLSEAVRILDDTWDRWFNN